MINQTFDPKRRFLLIRMLFLAAIGNGGTLLSGCVTGRPMRFGLRRIRGEVRVNGIRVSQDALSKPEGFSVLPDSVLRTGKGGYAVFRVGRDAFLLRENSQVKLTPATTALRPIFLAANHHHPSNDAGTSLQLPKSPQDIGGFFLASGAILSVFAPGRRRILKTPSAVIGIRGTGGYLEARPDGTYFCLCYGKANLQAANNPNVRESVTTAHHESPRFIHAVKPRIEPFPMINHEDAELVMLEALVGRRPPFYDSFGGEDTY